MDERIARVTEMEARLNRIAAWLEKGSGDVAEDVAALDAYYSGPLWRSDFEADEAGAFPAGLPRGVLSEDGICLALEEYRERTDGMAQGTPGETDFRAGPECQAHNL